MSSGPEFMTGIKDGNRVSREVAVIPAVAAAVAAVAVAAVEAAVAGAVAAVAEDIADLKPASRRLSASSCEALKKMDGLSWEPWVGGPEPQLGIGATEAAP